MSDMRQEIQSHIATGFVDPRTLEHSCREFVEQRMRSPGDLPGVHETLVDVVRTFEWATLRHIENAAYLAVNLESVDALRALVEGIADLDDPSGDYACVAIAAMRSFPGDDALANSFLPELLAWLRRERTAVLAFEALCDASPGNVPSYLSSIFICHSQKPELLRQVVTHVYYQAGNQLHGKDVLDAAVGGCIALVEAIVSHPLVPDELKKGFVEGLRAKADQERPRTAVRAFPNGFSSEARQRHAAVQERVGQGSCWE